MITTFAVHSRFVWIKIIPLVFFPLVLFLVFQRSPVSDEDVLAYSIFRYGEGTTLNLYDTSSHENTILYQSDDRLHFVFGSNGRIAFSTGWTWENNGELFTLDTTESESPLFNLSQELEIEGYPLGWSDDGNYLAFASEIDEGQQQAIYIWDGTAVIDVTPQNTLGNPQSFDVAWSSDGRLAFTVWFGYSNGDPHPEIYLWDGKATLNLSQNADAEDREPVWNGKGEIVFGSIKDNEYILLLWDGMSYDDGLPDVTSFVRVAPQLEIYSPYSTWVNDDLLTFSASARQGSHVQVYTWNRQISLNVSQNPDAHNGGSRSSYDGYLAFVTFFSELQRLVVLNERNEPVLETHGQYAPAWSSGGTLVFCRRNDRSGWNLLRWDRASVSTLVQGDEIFAQWRSGQATVCSDG